MSPLASVVTKSVPTGTLLPLMITHIGTGRMSVTVNDALAPGARLGTVPATKSSLVSPGVPLSSVMTMFVSVVPPVFSTRYVYVTGWPGWTGFGVAVLVSRMPGWPGGG